MHRVAPVPLGEVHAAAAPSAAECTSAYVMKLVDCDWVHSRCFPISVPPAIGVKKMQLLGFVEAVSQPAAIESAVALFGLDDQKRRRLAVNLRS
jgi:hypothetical protein